MRRTGLFLNTLCNRNHVDAESIAWKSCHGRISRVATLRRSIAGKSATALNKGKGFMQTIASLRP
jgi:hypothetical protein